MSVCFISLCNSYLYTSTHTCTHAHTRLVSHVFTVPLPDFLTVYEINVGDLPTGIVASFHQTGFVMNSSYLFEGLFHQTASPLRAVPVSRTRSACCGV